MRAIFGLAFGASLALVTTSSPVTAQATLRPTSGEGSAHSNAPAASAGAATADSATNEPYRWQQVDRIATAVTEAPVEYPAMLRHQQVEGRVVAEFVVDTLGRVEPKSVRIVSATHALFANAARSALPRARYTPAELEGRKVRQLVVLPVRFTQPR